ncbi:QbdB [Marinobacterium lacunae]|uniref:QbdB n=1 Tax=Marinobacterium lacunae TaxID=1232683 RepID=A0A081FWY9_9GAMM|nr:transporter [Marinobacterium lacunae]KEA63044.1 QbdB [Marinobacterium lacunae]
MQPIRLPICAILLAAAQAHAAEVAPGDYEQLPAGATLLALYYQHASTDELYSDGHEASSDFKLTSDVGIIRLIQAYQLNERLTVDPQFLLPFGHVSSSGDASIMGSGSGVGDLIVTAPLKYRLNDNGDILAVSPYLYLPTGSYDKNDSINLGENRWKVDLQVAYIKHFNEKWALDLVGDAIWYGDNDDYGSGSARLERDLSYEAQIMGRYMPDPTLTLGLGFGHQWGGETQVDGVDQNDKLDTTNVRISAAKFVTPRDQFLLQLGEDLEVDNGTKEGFRMNLRYLHVF